MRHLAATTIACAIALPAHAGFAPYDDAFRSVSAPAVAPGSFGVAGAALADGRLIAATGNSFYVETSVGSGLFDLAATFDATISDGSDPSFLSVSADGSTVALGAGFGRPVVTFDSALLDGSSVISTSNASVFNVDHFAAAWADDTTLVVTNSSGVESIDTVTGDTTLLINDFDGASAGIAFDSAGALYTANGFDLAPGGTNTGEIRAFDPSEWADAPASFQNDGTFIAEILSGSPLHFDGAGNLIVAGGDGADSGYVGVYDIDAGELAPYDPEGSGTAFYSAFVNHATGELVVQNGSDWYVYAVPAPGALALASFSLIALGRRRREN